MVALKIKSGITRYIFIVICIVLCSYNNAKAYEFTLQGNIFTADNLQMLPQHEIQLVNHEFGLIEKIVSNYSGFYKYTFTVEQDIPLKFYVYSANYCDSSITIIDSIMSFSGLDNLNLYVCYNHSQFCDANFITEKIDRSTLQFIDKSNENVISRTWDFGDGITSNDKNPIHSYNLSGGYLVSLSIETDIGCYASYEDSIYIESEKRIEGYVYAGVYKLSQGRVIAYSFDNMAIDQPFDIVSYPIDTGYFSILYDSVVNNILYFVPELDLPPFYAPVYLPTFLGNKKYWEESNLVSSSMASNQIAVNLIAEDVFYYGRGAIYGSLNISNENSVDYNDISILLLDSQKNPINYCFFDSEYNFRFPNIPLGDYYLLVNYIGVSSKPLFVSISENKPIIEVSLLEDSDYIVLSAGEVISQNINQPFPNPFSNVLYIPFNDLNSIIKEVQIISINGEIIQSSQISILSNSALDLSELSSGLYILKIGLQNYKIIKK